MSEYADRIARAQDQLGARGVDALCLSVGSDLPYLTGYTAMPLERLTMLVVPAAGDPVLVVPQLEALRVDLSHGVFDLRAWTELQDPIELVDDILAGAMRVALGDQTWSSFALALQDIGPERTWVPAGELMAALRIVKSSAEIDRLRAAAATVDAVVEQMSGVRFSGRSEEEVSREFSDRAIAGGHQSVGFAIVGSGPNGASPHHHASHRMIQHGDAVVCDFGGFQDGYGSDTTRMFVVGDAPVGFDDAFAVLLEAQTAAVDSVRPGVSAESVDAVARDIIEDAGYGDYFIHRTGHGIGMDTHEQPYIIEGNDTILEPGMAFSVEPGIYVEGSWGMRIEDIVVVTDDDVERLNTTDRSYRVVT